MEPILTSLFIINICTVFCISSIFSLVRYTIYCFNPFYRRVRNFEPSYSRLSAPYCFFSFFCHLDKHRPVKPSEKRTTKQYVFVREILQIEVFEFPIATNSSKFFSVAIYYFNTLLFKFFLR